MARALGTIILVAFLFQLITFAAGVAAGVGWFRAAPHILWGLLTSFLALFTLSATMFYLIGRGRYVKDVSRDLELGGEFVERTKRIKMRFFPVATWAILLTIGVSTTGGAITAWPAGHLMHGALAAAGVGLNSFALWRGLFAIGEDLAVGAEMDTGAGAAATGG